jgi:hypothetical protein
MRWGGTPSGIQAHAANAHTNHLSLCPAQRCVRNAAHRHLQSYPPAHTLHSTVTFVTKEQSPPEGFEQQGSVEEEEEREDAEPLHHLLHYK